MSDQVLAGAGSNVVSIVERVSPARLRCLIVLATAMLTAVGINEGGFRFPDASVHAMDGVFFLDLVREGGYTDVPSFGRQFYAHYPTLGFPYHYPPLFGVVEAVFFAFLGASAGVARLCVLCFHVASVVLLFEIVRRSHSQTTSLLAALLFATSPEVLFWSRQTMLEAPTVCMMLLATWLLLRYDERPTWSRALLWATGIVAALLAKQTAVFIIPAHGLYLLLRQGWRIVKRPEIIAVAGVLGVLLMAYSLFFATHSKFLMSMMKTGERAPPITGRLLSYPAQLPVLLGWPAFACAVIGAVLVARQRRAWPSMAIHACWAVSFYVTMLALAITPGRVDFTRATRYAYFWVPPFAVVGAYGFVSFRGHVRWRGLGRLAVVVLVSCVAVQAVRVRPASVFGPEEAARFVATLEGGASVLVDSHYDGDFVFFSRAHDRHGTVILRGSKSLYTFASFKTRGYTEFVRSHEDILELLGRYGTRYVVVENPDSVVTEPGTLLRQVLNTGAFRRLARIPLVRRRAHGKNNGYLDVYEYLRAQPMTATDIELCFPGLSPSVIRVPLRAAGQREGL